MTARKPERVGPSLLAGKIKKDKFKQIGIQYYNVLHTKKPTKRIDFALNVLIKIK